MCQYAPKLKLASNIGRFRLGYAIGACAALLIKGVEVNTGSKRGVLYNRPFFAPDIFRRKPQASDSTDEGKSLLSFLNLIRYIELIRKDTPREYGDHMQSIGKAAGKRKALAEEACQMAGIPDEFRLFIINEISVEAEKINFLFDNPSIFTNALLNKLFREKILNGELREPRIILSSLIRDSAEQGIDNVNKWLFLKLSHMSGSGGDLEKGIASGLYRGGWWADPVVRAFIRT